MLGEDYEEEIEPKFQQNPPQKSKNSENKKKKSRKKKERTQQIEQIEQEEEGEPEKLFQQKEIKRQSLTTCENCKNLKIKIKELEQLNEELLKIKDKLYKTNEGLLIQKEEILSQKNELENTNKQLERKNNELSQKISELSEEKNGYRDEIIGLKKQLMAKVNELNNLSKEKNINKNTTAILPNIINNNSKKEDNKNVDIISLSDSIPPKKDEERNNNNYVNIEEFNDLKKIIENLTNRINTLENWKQNFENNNFTPNYTINPNEEKNISLNTDIKTEKYTKKFSIDDNTSNENTLKSLVYNEVTDKKNLNQIIYENMDQLSKSMVIDARQKINPENEENSSSINRNKSRTTNSFNKKQLHERPKTPDNRKNQKQKFNSLIITDVEDLDLIARGLVKDNMDSLKNLRVGYKLIYRATEHGIKAEDFHKRVDNINSTLTVIKTKSGLVFGGYTSLSWAGEEIGEDNEKKDDKSFVFSLSLEKLYFENGKNDYSIICQKNKGPCFVGMFTIQDKILGVKEYVNPWGMQSYSGESTIYEINGGKSYFVADEVEVFQVIVKTS